MSKAIYVNHAGIVCSLGADVAAVEQNLFAATRDTNYLRPTDSFSAGTVLPLGMVNSHLADTSLSDENSRNNRMLAAALSPLLPQIETLNARYGSHRIGVVVGTSTSGIAEAEAALRCGGDGEVHFDSAYRYACQEYSAPSRFLSRWLQTSGPSWTQSSACTSGGKALASAARLLQLGVCDAVIAAGVDTLCRMTVAGFSSLSVVAKTRCLPFSRNRSGISLGEGAACFILSREPAKVRLAGVGESSDAYHISSPDPQGRGAIQAMQQGLKQAGLLPQHVDYLNLHGTATVQNDAMEALAVNHVFGSDIPCSSTKPLTGHTLAAAGAIEALFCWLTLQREDLLLPPHVWDAEIDPDLSPLHGLGRPSSANRVKAVMSNSFAFGGNNLSLVMVRE
ncbi:MAG: beta-ketoacyl-ACP synthase [Pseudomonadota bacterium]